MRLGNMVGHLLWFRVILKRNMNLTEKFDRYKKNFGPQRKCEISKILVKYFLVKFCQKRKERLR